MITKIESKENFKNVKIISSNFHYSIWRKFETICKQFWNELDANIKQIWNKLTVFKYINQLTNKILTVIIQFFNDGQSIKISILIIGRFLMTFGFVQWPTVISIPVLYGIHLPFVNLYHFIKWMLLELFYNEF